MEFRYDGKSKAAGIYKITNTQNGRIYIGSSVRFEKRWKQHQQSLKRGKHSNHFLQADFLKCGEEVFMFEILEVVEGGKEQRLEVEQRYLDKWFDGGRRCYNLHKEAVSREGCSDQKNRKNPWIDNVHPMLGRPMSEETKQKIGNANKGKQSRLGKRHTKEAKKLMSESHKRNKGGMYGRKQTNRQKQATVKARSIPIIQMDKQGHVIETWVSATEASRKLGISYEAIVNCVNGKTRTSAGFCWKRYCI